MTAFKYSAATLALLFASGMAYAQTSTTVQPQPGAENKIECPAPGSVAEADMPMECKNKGDTSATEMPKPDDSTAGTATTGTSQDNTAGTSTATEAPKEYNATGSETAPASDPNATATTTTTEVPKQDNQATTSGATTEGVATGTSPATMNAASVVLASQFMGQAVYSSGNENVGEINDLVMNKDLDNVVAIIGVGGFLGIGEKDVAIPIDQITVVKDENNNMRLTIAATKEQLDAAPTFDRTALK